MMKCGEIQELFGVYWDLPSDNLTRQAVDKHIEHCPVCAEEFQFWQETDELIRAATVNGGSEETLPISRKVMNRIYEDESWRIPVAERMYAISYKMRRNLSVVISFCLSLFLFSFLLSFIYERSAAESSDKPVFGIQAPQAISSASSDHSMDGHVMTAMASIGQPMIEPLKFHVGPIDSYSHYLLVLSILGMTSTLLIMNWLSHTKS